MGLLGGSLALDLEVKGSYDLIGWNHRAVSRRKAAKILPVAATYEKAVERADNHRSLFPFGGRPGGPSGVVENPQSRLLDHGCVQRERDPGLFRRKDPRREPFFRPLSSHGRKGKIRRLGRRKGTLSGQGHFHHTLEEQSARLGPFGL